MKCLFIIRYCNNPTAHHKQWFLGMLLCTNIDYQLYQSREVLKDEEINMVMNVDTVRQAINFQIFKRSYVNSTSLYNIATIEKCVQ